MLKIKFNFTAVLLLFIVTFGAYAVESLPQNLISFPSENGWVLAKDNLSENAIKLLANYTTQKTTTYCGVASAVMVLNSFGTAPYEYFTQDNFFNNKVERIIMPNEVQKRGMTLMQLSQALHSYGLKTDVVFANKVSLLEFRDILKKSLTDKKFVILNFLRTAMQQQGGGHHSPIAAYDPKTDRFLVLETARYKYPAYWAKTEDIWNAANTMDKDASRGIVIISQ